MESGTGIYRMAGWTSVEGMAFQAESGSGEDMCSLMDGEKRKITVEDMASCSQGSRLKAWLVRCWCSATNMASKATMASVEDMTQANGCT